MTVSEALSECRLCWVGGTLFWVGGGRWGIILGGWGWEGKFSGWVAMMGVGGGEWRWVHCLIIPRLNIECKLSHFS